MTDLIPVHGGLEAPVDRMVPVEAVSELEARAKSWKNVLVRDADLFSDAWPCSHAIGADTPAAQPSMSSSAAQPAECGPPTQREWQGTEIRTGQASASYKELLWFGVANQIFSSKLYRLHGQCSGPT